MTPASITMENKTCLFLGLCHCHPAMLLSRYCFDCSIYSKQTWRGKVQSTYKLLSNITPTPGKWNVLNNVRVWYTYVHVHNMLGNACIVYFEQQCLHDYHKLRKDSCFPGMSKLKALIGRKNWEGNLKQFPSSP